MNLASPISSPVNSPRTTSNKSLPIPPQETNSTSSSNLKPSIIKDSIPPPPPTTSSSVIKRKSILHPVESHKISKGLSSEEIEFLRVQEEIRKNQEIIQKNKKIYQKLKQNGGSSVMSTPVKSSQKTLKKLTQPKTPLSRLEQKYGKKICSLLKKSPQVIKKVVEKNYSMTTIPQPFHFRCEEKIKQIPTEEEKIKSMTAAELNEKFMKDPRSHTVPNFEPTTTIPNPPKLLLDERLRSHQKNLPLSTEEKEKLMMEEFNKNKFHARPFDSKIFQSIAPLGVSKVTPKPPTIPQEFNLLTERRHSFRPTPSVEPESYLFTPVKSDFHGRPLPGSSAKKAYHSSQVNKKRHSNEEFVLQTSLRFAQKKFEFEERKKQEEEALRKSREFKARPVLRSSFCPSTPSQDIKKKQLTTPIPFKLQSVALHEASRRQSLSELDLKKQRENENSGFKALPLPRTTYKTNFKIVHEDNHTILPQEVTLESDKRAIKRKEFNEEAEKKRQENEQKRLQELISKLDKENYPINSLKNISIKAGGAKRVSLDGTEMKNKVQLTNESDETQSSSRRHSIA